MSLLRLLAIVAGFGSLAFGAELHGAWSASAGAGRNLAGTWTAEAHSESGGVTGAWTLRDATGQVLIEGGWSASKSPQAWSGAWRATVAGRTGEYSGTWEARTSLAPKAALADMLESALRAVVSGTWKTGGDAGSWSVRASP
jgi:hypothetical protein